MRHQRQKVSDIFIYNIGIVRVHCELHPNFSPSRITWAQEPIKNKHIIVVKSTDGYHIVLYAPSRKQAKLLVSTLCLLYGATQKEL